MTRLGCALVLLVLSGCTVFADRDDYLTYRQVARAPAGAERLRSLRAYLDRFAEGNWSASARAELQAAEGPLFEAGKHSESGLALYLDVYPQGRHAAAARARQVAIALAARADNPRDAAPPAPADTRPVAQLLDLLERFATLEPGRAALSALVARETWLRDAFAQAPAARCDQQTCAKRFPLAYFVPIVAGSRIDRRADLWIRLSLREGQLTQVDFWLPNHGFSRLFESEKHVLVDDSDPDARGESVGWLLRELEARLERPLAYAEREAGGEAASLAPLPGWLSPEETPLTFLPGSGLLFLRWGGRRMRVFAAPVAPSEPVEGLLVDGISLQYR